MASTWCIFPPLPEDGTEDYCCRAVAVLPGDSHLLPTLREWCSRPPPPQQGSDEVRDMVAALRPYRLPFSEGGYDDLLPAAVGSFLPIFLEED